MFEKLFQKIKEEDQEAMSIYGFYLYEGLNLLENKKKAVKLFKKSESYPISQYYLSKGHRKGIYLQKDIQLSIQYLKKSALQNYPPALTKLGERYYYGLDGVVKDRLESLVLWQISSEKGDTKAITLLNVCFRKQTQEDKRIIKDIKRRSNILKLGCWQLVLGYLYQTGNGLKKNLEKALRSYKNAAKCNLKQISALAYWRLGNLFFTRDFQLPTEKSLSYYLKSSQLGSANSYYHYIRCTNALKKSSISPEELYRSYLSALNQGSLRSLIGIGACLMDGYGCKLAPEKGFGYWNYSMRMGLGAGTSNVGFCYHNRYGVETRSLDLAMQYYHFGSMKQLNYNCMKNLSICLKIGSQNLQNSIVDSIWWLACSAALGEKDSQLQFQKNTPLQMITKYMLSTKKDLLLYSRARLLDLQIIVPQGINDCTKKKKKIFDQIIHSFPRLLDELQKSIFLKNLKKSKRFNQDTSNRKGNEDEKSNGNGNDVEKKKENENGNENNNIDENIKSNGILLTQMEDYKVIENLCKSRIWDLGIYKHLNILQENGMEILKIIKIKNKSNLTPSSYITNSNFISKTILKLEHNFSVYQDFLGFINYDGFNVLNFGGIKVFKNWTLKRLIDLNLTEKLFETIIQQFSLSKIEINSLLKWVLADVVDDLQLLRKIIKTLEIDIQNKLTLKNYLINLYTNQANTMDFKIICSNGIDFVLCHKSVLIARCKLFKNMFSSIENDCAKVSDYTNKSPLTFQIFIKFLYFNKLKVSWFKDSPYYSLKHVILNQLEGMDDFYQLNIHSNFNSEIKKIKNHFQIK
ncbi:sel-1-like protein [Anaeramoeba flamelloides]|uniref:Sel-1-like protein n=1 Tax=Anaeramoeba flamelloides TaxID=1746091 RepID=A0AAV7ZBQ9_9EUKA|nr:sel-1-like protein [Anaeramoeba flamelloides]